MTKEQLVLKPIDLRVDRLVIKDNINHNDMRWILDKTVEELIELADAITHYKKEEVADEQMCVEIADVYIQISILHEIFSKPIIQQMINNKLLAIAARNQRIRTKNTFGKSIGFQPKGGI